VRPEGSWEQNYGTDWNGGIGILGCIGAKAGLKGFVDLTWSFGYLGISFLLSDILPTSFVLVTIENFFALSCLELSPGT
jgi:hypothetical protein